MEEFKLDNYSDISKSMYIKASAGTGKTYNITGIVKKLIDKNVKLEEILIVTYTEKAAGELRDRIRAKCPDEDVDNAPIFTIHSFCQQTLGEFSFTANQCANLSLVEDDVLEDFIDRWIRDDLKNNDTFKNLFKTAEKQSTFINNLKRDFKEALSKYYLDFDNNEKCNIVSLDDKYVHVVRSRPAVNRTYTFEECDNLLSQAETDYESVRNQYTWVFSGRDAQDHKKKLHKYFKTKLYMAELKNLYIAWQHEKEKNKMQSYDDMLRSVREAVCQPNSLLKKQLQKKYKYAIIDEFQDTNQKQWDIFKTVFMEDPDHVIIVVGDPKQSIYSFQGADVNVYENAIQAIAGNGGSEYYLGTNYRSTDTMVERCNDLFKPKNGLKPFFSQTSGITFSASEASHKKAQATYCGKITEPVWIAGASGEKVNEQSFAEIAVQQIIDCCTFENGKTKLQVFDKEKEDNDGNCRELRDVSFHDFAILVRSSSEYTEVERALKKAGVPSLRYKDANLFAGKECMHWISLFNAITAKDFTGSKRAILSEALFTDFFCIPLKDVENEIFDNPSCTQRQTIIQWQKIARKRKWAKLLENIFEVTNIENRLSDLGQMQSLTKIRQIGKYAVDYLYKTDSSLEDVSKHLLRLSTSSDNSLDDGDIVEKGTDFDCVQLMTIHASKGLEFPVVIVPSGLRDRNNNAAPVWLYHDENRNAKLSFTDYGKAKYQLEEDYERERLFYVAYTRASSILVLPVYDIWEHKEGHEDDECIYDFLNDNIIALSCLKDEEENPLTRTISHNRKSFEILKDNVLDILKEFKKKKDKEIAGHILKKDITEEEQLDVTKELSSKVPSLSIYKHSYSSLSSKKKDNEEMTENGGRTDKEGTDSKKESLAAFDMAPNPVSYIAVPGEETSCPPPALAPYTFPKGKKLGIALHEVFEKADFSVSQDDEELRRLITACFKKQTLNIPPEDPDQWLTYTTGLLWNTLNAKLPEISGTVQTGNYFKLSELADADRISEAEFNMDADITGALKNYCNGFIDLVFKRNINGRDVYSILDWKSDTLNPEDYPDFDTIEYSNGELLKKRTDDHYSIQRVLYSFSLIKWLANFYPNETEAQVFENHFGGIYYAYIRGCCANTCSGIYARTWSSWQELEIAFKKIMGAVYGR